MGTGGPGILTRADGSTLSMDELKRMFMEALGEEEKDWLFPGGLTDGIAVEIREFFEAMRGRCEKVEVDGRVGLQALAVCMALYESSIAGEAVRIEDVIAGKWTVYQAEIDAHWNLDANYVRPNPDGARVGGRQASSASKDCIGDQT